MALTFNGTAQDKALHLKELLAKLESRGQFDGQVLFSKKGNILLNKAYGTDKRYGALTTETKINVESIAKEATAIAIAVLVDKGNLEFDDLLSKHIPEIKSDQVTLRHVLTHTSGFPRLFELVFEKWPHDQFLSNNDLIDLIEKEDVNLDTTPGEGESYNQTAYMLLATVVEKASGTNFSEFVHAHIFKPANMENSIFITDSEALKSKIGAANIDNMFAYTLGDGNMYSTAEDLFKLNRALANGKILSKSILDELYKPLVLNNGEKGRYCLGGNISTNERGESIVQYIGQGEGTNAIVDFNLTSNQITIVFHVESVFYAFEVYQTITSAFEGKRYELPEVITEHLLPEELISKYVGDYGDNGFMHITTENGKLFIQPDGNPGKMEIVPSSDTTFFFRNQPVFWQIYLDEHGNVIGFGPQGEKQHMMRRFGKN